MIQPSYAVIIPQKTGQNKLSEYKFNRENYYGVYGQLVEYVPIESLVEKVGIVKFELFTSVYPPAHVPFVA